MNPRLLAFLVLLSPGLASANGGPKKPAKKVETKKPDKPKKVNPMIQTPWFSAPETGVEFFIAEVLLDPLELARERAYRITGGSKAGLMQGDRLMVFRGADKKPVAELMLFDVRPGRSYGRILRTVNPKYVAGLRYHTVMMGDMVSLIQQPSPRVWLRPKTKRKRRRRRVVRRPKPKPFMPKAGEPANDGKITVGGRELPRSSPSAVTVSPAQRTTAPEKTN